MMNQDERSATFRRRCVEKSTYKLGDLLQKHPGRRQGQATSPFAAAFVFATVPRVGLGLPFSAGFDVLRAISSQISAKRLVLQF